MKTYKYTPCEREMYVLRVSDKNLKILKVFNLMKILKLQFKKTTNFIITYDLISGYFLFLVLAI